MGSLTFIRIAGAGQEGERITFDASPQFTLEQKYGYNSATLELRETSRDDNFIKYDVLGAHQNAKVRPVGQLIQKTRERVWAELNR